MRAAVLSGAPGQLAPPPLSSHWSHLSSRTRPSRCRPEPPRHHGAGGAPGLEAAAAPQSKVVPGSCYDTGWTASR